MSFFKQLLFLIENISKTDLIFCHFSGYVSFLPTLIGRIFNIPRLTVIAGTEGHCYPSINYGSLRKTVYGWFTLTSLRNSSHLSPVHKTLAKYDDDYYGKDNRKQGYLNFAPDIVTPSTEIHYGYNDKDFYPVPGVRRTKNSFLTVATTYKEGEFFRKGADLIIEMAKIFPEFSFTIIGKSDSRFPALPNLRLIDNVPNHELKKHFSSHEFYFQLSIAEGFPNALCEAMLCGCIPIGSSAYSIPQIIGDAGFTLKTRNKKDLREMINQATNCDKQYFSARASDRVRINFNSHIRMKKLILLIKSMLPSSSVELSDIISPAISRAHTIRKHYLYSKL